MQQRETPEIIMQPGHYHVDSEIRPDGTLVASITVDDGPWSVYECVCLKCWHRNLAAAPVAAEDVPLWECDKCSAMAVEYREYEGDE